MIDVKGSAWLNQFGDTNGRAFETWCLVMKDLTEEKIQQGFIKYLESGSQFLDASKFKELCLDEPGDKNPGINFAAYQIYQKKSPESQESINRSKEVGKHTIEYIRRNLL